MGGLLELVGSYVGRFPDGGSTGVQPPRSEEAADEEAGRTASTAAAKERRPLVDAPSIVKHNTPSGASRDSHTNLIQRVMLNVDEHVNVKVLLRMWGPRLESVVRLMLVSTFLDDSFRVATHFAQHVEQVSSAGYCPAAIAMVLLAVGLVAQSLGSLCLLAPFQAEVATAALIGWALTQPLLYSQLPNLEFMSESLSLIGGLLMLRVHLLSNQQPPAEDTSTPSSHSNTGSALALTQLFGRLLLPTAYIYQAGRFFLSAFTLDETTSLGMYLSSLSMFFVHSAVLVALVVASMLVATGLKSRTVALLLALANIGFVLIQHPFFRFLTHEDGEWKVDEDNMWMPNVVMPKGVAISDFDSWQIYDLHRYYFFLGLSTSGALLLLAQFGPGDIAMQKDEVLLPVSRAKD